MKKSRPGSVLMEFVIVLPLYMLLLGFAFVMGELSLHSIRLAGGADRSCALSSAAFEAFKEVASPNEALSYAGDGGSSARVSSFVDTYNERTWNGFLLREASVSDYYTLTPLTRGFVAFWYRDAQNRLERNGDSGLYVAGGALDEMIRDSGVIGRVRGDDGLGMTGRERDLRDSRAYGFVTLVRNEPGSMVDAGLADFTIYEMEEGLRGWTR